MWYIYNLFDLSTLDIESLKLSDIPDFTIEDTIELHQLIRQNARVMLTWDDAKRFHSLQFLKAADNARDRALDDRFPEFTEEDETRALQNMARVLLLEEEWNE